MNYFIKGIITFISVFIFIFIIFITFFVSQYSGVSNIEVNLDESGTYEVLISSGSEIEEKKLDLNESKENENALYYQTINYIDKLYFSKLDSYKSTLNDKGSEIELNKNGLFFMEHNDISKKYVLLNKNFSIKTESPGNFYFNIQNNQIVIFSLSSVLEVNFFSSDGRNINKIYLYPHEYISFNSNKNLLLENIDFVRIAQILSNFSYFPDKIKDIKRGDKFSLIILKDGGYDFITNILKILENNSTKVNVSYKKLSNIEILDNPISDFIYNNFNFLYNDSKKTIYYKNRILANLSKLFKGDIYDYELEKGIVNDFVELKNIDANEYDKVFDIFIYYYKINIQNDKEYNYNKLIGFTNLLGSINNLETENYTESSLLISDIYNSFDYNDISLRSFSNKMYNFGKLFISRYLLEKQKSILNNTLNDYTLFYWNKYINSNFNNNYSDKSFIFSYLGNVSQYLDLHRKVYSYGSKKRKEAGLYDATRLLKDLDNFFRNIFFEKERTNKGLLVKNMIPKYEGKYLDLFEKELLLFIGFIENNKNLIKERYKDQYILNIKNFREYFSALSDYDDYKLKYNDTNKELFEVNSIVDDNLKSASNELSREKFINYILSFEGVNKLGINVEIIDNKYYKVNKLLINGRSFSFELNPKRGNELSNIIIDGNKKFFSYNYELDSLEKKWKEILNTVDASEKSKYEFKNFFINSFFFKELSNDGKIKEIDISQNDSDIVKKFKRDKLLLEKGDFNSLKSLNIKYQNLFVNLYDDIPEIKIKSNISRFNIENQSYTINFDSDYKFGVNLHSFYNTKFRIFEDYQNDSGKYLFGGSYINIIGDTYVLKLEEKIIKILGYINDIGYQYEKIVSLGVKNITFEYISKRDILQLKSTYKNKNLVIGLKANIISYVLYNGKSVEVENDSPFSELTSILSDLK